MLYLWVLNIFSNGMRTTSRWSQQTLWQCMIVLLREYWVNLMKYEDKDTYKVITNNYMLVNILSMCMALSSTYKIYLCISHILNVCNQPFIWVVVWQRLSMSLLKLLKRCRTNQLSPPRLEILRPLSFLWPRCLISCCCTLCRHAAHKVNYMCLDRKHIL